MERFKLPFVTATKSRMNKTVPVLPVDAKALPKTLEDFSAAEKNWVASNGFAAKPGDIIAVPDERGAVSKVLFGFDAAATPLNAGSLARKLPDGLYRLEIAEDRQAAALGIALGAYRFARYKEQKRPNAEFVPQSDVDMDQLTRDAEAAYLVRDLINTPTSDMGPDELEAAVRKLATRFKATVSVTRGNDLLKKNFPMIHAVGRASTSAPRLLDMKWGRAKDPKVTLVGKGVCFDTGGLNIKPGSSMALMKKDMGGAANVLGLAMMIMAAKLPVRLRVLIPAVENSISGNAFRPGDILPSRKGITVEIGNTDAEGRLVLGDALALGDEEKPQLMIDMATLTGAARVALGPDLPPFYTDDEGLAEGLAEASVALHDPLWRMPLWKPYNAMLSSRIADTNHITSGGFAGSVTAALFLQKFVEPATPWIHLDVFGWVPTAKPWCPVGGEAQGIRALYQLISDRFAKA